MQENELGLQRAVTKHSVVPGEGVSLLFGPLDGLGLHSSSAN